MTKLNAAGNALVYSTYLGGSDDDGGRGIAVDTTGNAYVIGQTNSTDFPTASPVQPAYGGTGSSGLFAGDAFVTKLNAAGNALVYSTYLGGNITDIGVAIAADAPGNAYVTGITSSMDFPTTGGAFQATFGAGSGHAFIAKITVALPDIIPQIANTGTPESGFFTIFSAVNVTSGPATVTVEFFDSQGAPMSMPTLGGEFVGFTATLQPGGYTAVQTVPNGSGARIGYARITSTPNDSVAVNATFVQLVPGRPPFMAGIPATNTRHSTAYVPYVSDGGFTPSLALVSRVAQTVTLTARSGVEGAVRCSTTLSFVDGEHRAFLLRDVLPCTATGEGSLEILGSSSTPELSGIGFLANDEGAFVTQPIWSR